MSDGPRIRYRPAPDAPWTVLAFAGDRADAFPFELCNAARERIFPGVAVDDTKAIEALREMEKRYGSKLSAPLRGPDAIQAAIEQRRKTAAGQVPVSASLGGRVAEADRAEFHGALKGDGARAKAGYEQPSSAPTASATSVKDTGRSCPDPAAPRRGVRDASLIAYRAAEWAGSLSRQQRLVMDLFSANRQRDFTRQELAQALDLGINVICGRVAELRQEPFELLEECGRRTCRVTGESSNALRLAERVQQPLFSEAA